MFLIRRLYMSSLLYEWKHETTAVLFNLKVSTMFSYNINLVSAYSEIHFL